jgi:cell division protein FtsZ
MNEDLIDFNLPKNSDSIITIVGVGGGGNNAVNRMFDQGIEDVDFMVVNTDAQALKLSLVPQRIQIGETLTEGRGAGNRADVGEQAAVENIENVMAPISNGTKMVFIVAGMGGGTGTGAAPVISKACRDMGILTVAVVTLPFRFEGPLRMRQAIQGIQKLKKEVDALLIIHNEKLREIYGNLSLSTAFGNADNVLMLAVKGIAEIITLHGYINVDFADVLSVMTDGGIAFMGSAEAAGFDRAKEVIEKTVNSPLLNNNDIRGARKVLLNITSGTDEITVDEIGVITDTIISKVGGDVNTIWGTCTDETLGDNIRITLVATGFDEKSIPNILSPAPPQKTSVPLEKKTETKPANESHIIPLELLDQDENQENQKPNNQEKTAEVLDVQAEVELLNDKPVEEKIKETNVISEKKKPAFDPFFEENERERIKAERLKALNYNNLSDPNQLDEIEKTPAYKRKKSPVQPGIFEEAEAKSRYTIGSDDKGLKPNNPYIFDAVD